MVERELPAEVTDRAAALLADHLPKVA
jgi:hypothetical protein